MPARIVQKAQGGQIARISLSKEEEAMRLKSFGLVLLIVIVGAFLSGCGCFYQAMKGEKTPPAPPAAQAVPPQAKTEKPIPPAHPAVAATMVMLKDVHFDFDRYNIRPADAELLKQDSEWFKTNPKARVRVEGYCDERGTIEYNLILGQKRADSAKSFLQSLGVNGALIDTVSYGKEKPLDPGHNEKAWAKNRRAHFMPLK